MWLTRFNACWETRVETSESRLVLTPSLRVSGRTPTMELFTSCHQASQWSSQDPSKCRVDNKQRLDNEHRTHLCDTSLYCDLQYFRFFLWFLRKPCIFYFTGFHSIHFYFFTLDQLQ